MKGARLAVRWIIRWMLSMTAAMTNLKLLDLTILGGSVHRRGIVLQWLLANNRRNAGSVWKNVCMHTERSVLQSNERDLKEKALIAAVYTRYTQIDGVVRWHHSETDKAQCTACKYGHEKAAHRHKYV